jgi:hypothetical protein
MEQLFKNIIPLSPDKSGLLWSSRYSILGQWVPILSYCPLWLEVQLTCTALFSLAMEASRLVVSMRPNPNALFWIKADLADQHCDFISTRLENALWLKRLLPTSQAVVKQHDGRPARTLRRHHIVSMRFRGAAFSTWNLIGHLGGWAALQFTKATT